MVRSVWPGRAVTAGLVLAGVLAGGSAKAVFVTDLANDFIPSYHGPKNADLDVIGVEVTLDKGNFLFHAVLNGAVGTTPGGFYVLGINRGTNTQGFPTIAPGVLFDRVVVIQNTGTGTIPGFGNLAPGAVTISGNELFALIPGSALPSTGFAPSQYTFNLWPRSPVIAGDPLGNISDFAPDNSNALVTTTPAPPGLLLGVAAFLSAAVGDRLRAGRRAAA